MEANWEKIWKIGKKSRLNSEKWYGKYGRKVGWIVKVYWKYGSKLWKDMKNTEE